MRTVICSSGSGTRASPRRADLLARVDSLCGEAPTNAAVAAIGRILRYVGRQARRPAYGRGSPAQDAAMAPRARRAGPLVRAIRGLRRVQLDPVRKPGVLPRCAGQPRSAGITDYLGWLGVESNPTVRQVVDHLRFLIDAGSTIGKNIYLFLNTHADDAAIDELLGTACLEFGDVAYRADQVFWGEHGLAPYAHGLSVDLRQYGAFLARLDVKELPDHEDALRVLAILGADTGHRLLAPEQVEPRARLLADPRARTSTRPSSARPPWPSSGYRPSIPNGAPILERPGWLYFDDRPGLRGKLGPSSTRSSCHG